MGLDKHSERDVIAKAAAVNASRYNFAEHGVQVSPGPLLTAGEIAEVADHAWRVLNGQYETGVEPRSNTGGPDVANHPPYIEAGMAQDADNVLANIIRNKRLAEWTAEVTGARRLKVWNFMVMAKYPTGSSKTVVGWHQDRRYFEKLIKGRTVNLWVALSDVPVEMGPLRFVPGSHKWGRKYSTGFFEHDTDKQREEIEVPEGQVWEEFDSVLPAGWGSVHHEQTLHGSGPNTGSKVRLNMLLNYGIDDFEVLPDTYFATRQHDTVATPVVYPSA